MGNIILMNEILGQGVKIDIVAHKLAKVITV